MQIKHSLWGFEIVCQLGEVTFLYEIVLQAKHQAFLPHKMPLSKETRRKPLIKDFYSSMMLIDFQGP